MLCYLKRVGASVLGFLAGVVIALTAFAVLVLAYTLFQMVP
jgi:hypothetical protein